MNTTENIITNIVTAIVMVSIVIAVIFRVRHFFKYGLAAGLKQRIARSPQVLNKLFAGPNIHQDDSIHWYRVKTNGEIVNPKILSVTKYS